MSQELENLKYILKYGLGIWINYVDRLNRNAIIIIIKNSIYKKIMTADINLNI